MRSTSIIFTVLTLCGLWQPISWTSARKRSLYKIYVSCLVLLMHSLTFTQIMDMIVNVNDTESFTDNIYLLLPMIITCCKMITLLASRMKITIMFNMLLEEPFVAVNQEEVEIQNKFEEVIRMRLFHYATLVESAAIIMAISSFILNYKKRQLGFRAWLPFDYSSGPLFFLVYSHQWFCWIIAATLNICNDITFCGLLLHISCQFEILKCRLGRITSTSVGELGGCVRHHNKIYRFACKINETFRVMLFLQFFSSTFLVCFTLLQVVKYEGIDANILQLMFYMGAMLSQVFLYCWCGNEVKLKSLQLGTTIYELNWTAVSNDSKRILLLMMRRSMIPIEFTSAAIITMNLESFVRLLKTSYSAYNLLHQMQEQ